MIPNNKPKSKADQELELAEFISRFYYDPLGYVQSVFPWGEGPLAGQSGPDEWQTEYLIHLGQEVAKRNFDGVNAVSPIKEAVSSGHGIGKSTMSAWLASWIMDTRPYSKGTVTANTGVQLNSKTFAAIKTWKKLAITAHWWDIGAEKIRHKDHPEDWFVSAQTSNEDKSEAFAGQHAANSTSWYLFDEASAISDKIFEVAQGGITDGEPMWFIFGNATRNSGCFYEACFGQDKHRWNSRCIDSRTSRFTNKTIIAEWIADHGEDSDFVRVRVRGLPPSASDTQFIPSDLVRISMSRDVTPLDDEPLLAGVDLSRGGQDPTVVRFRMGQYAKFKPIDISGQDTRDSMRVVGILANLLTQEFDTPAGSRRITTMFLDETGMGGPLGDRLRQMGHRNVIGVQFGGGSPANHTANMRAYIWYMMREWLKSGAIGRDTMLEAELTGPGYTYNAQTAYVLESKESMKKRGVGSPNHADALACTFAAPIAFRKQAWQTTAKIYQLANLRRSCSDAWMA